jgi:hypothetical protein
MRPPDEPYIDMHGHFRWDHNDPEAALVAPTKGNRFVSFGLADYGRGELYLRDAWGSIYLLHWQPDATAETLTLEVVYRR